MAVCQLFVTCLVDGFAPSVGKAVVALLEGLGLTVEFDEDQTCCGQPAYNAGYRRQAVRMAAHTVRVLERTRGPIVVPSGSCTDMLVHHVPRLLAEDPELGPAAERVAARVRELTRFLVEDLGVVKPPGRMSARVAYHPSCHGLRNLGIRPQMLIEAVEGVEPCELPAAEECCGFGGLFSIELPEVSAAIMARKLEAIEASGAEVVVGTDLGCLMHIAGGLNRRGSRIRVMHIAELLAGPASGPT